MKARKGKKRVASGEWQGVAVSPDAGLVATESGGSLDEAAATAWLHTEGARELALLLMGALTCAYRMGRDGVAAGEPLVAVPTPVLTPGKSGDLTPKPPTMEWIGSAVAKWPALTDREPFVELNVSVDGDRVVIKDGDAVLEESESYSLSLDEAMTLACALMEASQFIVRGRHRAHVEADLAALHRECEEAPV